MIYFGEGLTDIGITKKTNQDSLCFMMADTKNHGQILMAIICDGMGGLEKGEVASATVINRFSKWFKYELINELEQFSFERIETLWNDMITECNRKLIEYGKACQVNLGTTITAMLCIDDQYLIGHVGDTRVYILNDGITQITEDQTFIAREIKAGNMTMEEAMKDPRRNMLLQCVGSSKQVVPVFYRDKITRNACYMLCSDGFRHVIDCNEIYERLCPRNIENNLSIKENGQILIDLVKERKEKDNISVIVFKAV